MSKQLMMPVPSIDLVRVVSKVPRGKCHGPDGVWPYLIYKLPDVCLRTIHRVVEYVWDGGDELHGLFDAHLLALYKKGDWGVASSWRPISMTNAIYRIIDRCLLPMVVDLVERRVGEYQFGARKGKSCAQAMLELMDKMDDLKRRKEGFKQFILM